MTIPNLLTLLRLVLTPLIAVLACSSTTSGRAWALGVFLFAMATDTADGIIAKRTGQSSLLGLYLDPVVDKIFLVAVYVPLADLGVVPLGLVIVLFVRELAVTPLRSIALEEEYSFRTTRAAKLKTGVQMAGAGFVFLIWMFPRGSVIVPVLTAAVAASLVPSLVALARGKKPGWRAI